MRIPLFAASCLGGVSVVMGAMGGHHTGDARAVWMTGVYMGLVHALAAMLAALLSDRAKLARVPAGTFTLGGALFGGSIWIKTLVWGAGRTAVADAERSALEQIIALMAPLGGVTLMISWALLAIAVLGYRRD